MNTEKNHRQLAVRLLIVAVFLYIGFLLNGEQLVSTEWGYALDIPEAYSLVAKSGTTRYHFSNAVKPVDLHIAIYPTTQFDKPEMVLSYVQQQFQAEGKSVEFTWLHRPASIGKLESERYEGWIASVALADNKGWMVLVAVAEPKSYVACEPMIISTLESFFPDGQERIDSGPMMAFAWANQKEIIAEIMFQGKKLLIPLNEVDAEANQAVVDREFSLLTAYLGHERVIPAWQRYYRMIYRDAWKRLERAGCIITGNVVSGEQQAAADILSWLQGFSYERNREGSDFVNLVSTLTDSRGDCDSRALLMVILLHNMGIDAILLVSPDYSHAVAAVDCPGEGARYELGGKRYLIADTTAKAGLGMIAADMADSSKWFPVRFATFPEGKAADTTPWK